MFRSLLGARRRRESAAFRMQTARPYPAHYCFPGYQAACLLRVLRLGHEAPCRSGRRAFVSCSAMGRGGAGALATASVEELREVFLALPLEQRQQLEAACGSEIPKAWGWPKEAYDPEDLRLYVQQATKPTQQEAWDDALAQRSIDGKKEDFVEEKAFANLLLNKDSKWGLKHLCRSILEGS